MVDLLHTDALQLLEVAILGSPVVQVIDHLAKWLTQSQASTSTLPAQF